MSGALEGIRIVDLSAMFSGPQATLMLAEQGAEVIKVEQPRIGDGTRHIGSRRGGTTALFASLNRSKQSIVVDLRHELGAGLVRDLAASADLFVQNFRPGVIERLGLGESELRRDHPELIYVSISAFGEEGPWARRPVFDSSIQGMTGAAYIQSNPPQLMQQVWCDKATALTAAQAMTAALFARERGAGGQHLRIQMLDAALAFLWPDAHEHATFIGPGAELMSPMVGALRPVKTADGCITIMPVTDEQMTRFLVAVGREELLLDPRFATREARNANIREWRAEIAADREEFTSEELIARLVEADVPCSPILRPDEVAGFEQVVASGSLVELDDPGAGRILQPRPPARFEGTPEAIRSPAPSLGEHTTHILEGLGRSHEEIEQLRAEGVVA